MNGNESKFASRSMCVIGVKIPAFAIHPSRAPVEKRPSDNLSSSESPHSTATSQGHIFTPLTRRTIFSVESSLAFYVKGWKFLLPTLLVQACTNHATPSFTDLIGAKPATNSGVQSHPGESATRSSILIVSCYTSAGEAAY